MEGCSFTAVLSLGHKDWIHANAGTAVIPAALVAWFVGQGLGPGDWGSGQGPRLPRRIQGMQPCLSGVWLGVEADSSLEVSNSCNISACLKTADLY